jgi:hypothetical protein
MAMQTVEVASVGEVPNNGYWRTSRLRISDSEVCDALYHIEHALARKRVFH